MSALLDRFTAPTYQPLPDLEADDHESALQSPPPAPYSIPWKNVFFVAVNTLSTITITFLNKIVVRDEQLRSCQTSFAMFHFTCTFIVLLLASMPQFQLFRRVRVPVLRVLPLCALFAGFLILGNISLQLNDIAFYTLTRLMTCPTVILLNFLLFWKKVSRSILFSVVLLTTGVMFANGKAAGAHPLGAAVAVTAFSVTAAYQIWIQKKMGDLGVSAPQLLFNQAPVAAIMLIFVAPFTDTIPDIAKIQSHTWTALLASGVVASLINITQFLIIGATSALTVICILSIGWFTERRWPTLMDLSGATVALCGAWLYAHASSIEKRDNPAKDAEKDEDEDKMEERQMQLQAHSLPQLEKAEKS